MLTNKTILITGGTSPLGEHYVRRAREEGARVFFTFAHNLTLALALEQTGATPIKCDFLKQEDVSHLVEKIKDSTDTLDVLINSAAIVRNHMLKNMSEKEWDDVLEANLFVPIQLTFEFEEQFKEGSKIINLISNVGIHGGIGISNYAAAKDGLLQFTRTSASQLGVRGISVLALNPGFMDSAMTEDVPPELVQANKDKSYLNTLSDPKEVAEFLIHLCGDKVKSVSGQVFHYETRKVNF